MRTYFETVDSQPVQRISVDASMPLPVIDLSALEEGELAERARLLARREAARNWFPRRLLERSKGSARRGR